MLSRFFLTTFCCAALAVPSFAQNHPSAKSSHTPDADELEWQRYKLTMPKVDEWAAANRKIGEYLKAHPELKNKHSDIGDAKTMAEAERRARAEAPQLVAAITGAGLSFREWWDINASLLMAYMTVQMQEARPDLPASKTVRPENIAFVKANKQKIATLFAEFQKWNEQNSDKQ